MSYRFTTSLPYLLNRVGVQMGEQFSQHLAKHDLSLAMYRVMAVLRQEGKQSLGDLSQMVSVELSTLSRLIGTLQKRLLVTRIRLENNARMVHIDLTPRGVDLVEELMPIAAKFEILGTQDFSDEEISWLKQALVKIYQNFEN